MAITTGLNLRSIGSFFSGLSVFVIAVVNLENLNAWQIIQFSFFFVVSMVVLFSFNIISAAIVFKWVGNSRVFELFDCVTNFGMYPKTIFSKATQNFISYVIPITAIGFYPSVILLNKNSQGAILSSVISIIFLILSLRFWKFMLAKYTSAGG